MAKVLISWLLLINTAAYAKWDSCSSSIFSISGGRGTRGKITFSGFCGNNPMKPVHKNPKWQRKYIKKIQKARYN